MTEQNMVPPMPAGMPSVEEVLLQSNDIPWREVACRRFGENALAG